MNHKTLLSSSHLHYRILGWSWHVWQRMLITFCTAPKVTIHLASASAHFWVNEDKRQAAQTSCRLSFLHDTQHKNIWITLHSERQERMVMLTTNRLAQCAFHTFKWNTQNAMQGNSKTKAPAIKYWYHHVALLQTTECPLGKHTAPDSHDKHLISLQHKSYFPATLLEYKIPLLKICLMG